jgi:hypothetical protein
MQVISSGCRAGGRSERAFRHRVVIETDYDPWRMQDPRSGIPVL